MHKRSLLLTSLFEFWCWVVPMLALFFSVMIRPGVPQMYISVLVKTRESFEEAKKVRGIIVREISEASYLESS
jgi:hypothetical protein